jgi:parvulin-like peptidyl-prolyl isomerase
MNQKIRFFLVLSLLFTHATYGKRVSVNKIVARLNGANILKSDLEKPRIVKNGGTYSFSELFLEELIFQQAAVKKIIPTEAEINRQIVSLKIQNGMSDMSDAEFENELKETGFTMPEYKLELARVLAVENLKRAEISEKIVITSQQVEQFYKEHPDHSPEQYNMSLSILTDSQVKTYKEAVKKKELEWIDLGWVNPKDIDAKYNFIASMTPKTISKPIQIDNSYRLLKLNDKKEKTLRSLDERYNEIERQLHNTLRDEVFTNFQKEIKEKAALVSLT